jgi:hypothetical protein
MKVFMKVGFFALVLLFSQNLVAQESAQENNDFLNYYNTELFQWSYGFWSGLTLNYQNQSSNTTFGLKKSMQNALALYDDTNQKLLSYKKKALLGNIFTWTGCAAILASQFIPIPDLISDSNYSSTTIYAYYGFFGGGLVSVLIGGLILTSGQENIFDAVNLYNRNKLAEYKSNVSSQR